MLRSVVVTEEHAEGEAICLGCKESFGWRVWNGTDARVCCPACGCPRVLMVLDGGLCGDKPF